MREAFSISIWCQECDDWVWDHAKTEHIREKEKKISTVKKDQHG